MSSWAHAPDPTPSIRAVQGRSSKVICLQAAELRKEGAPDRDPGTAPSAGPARPATTWWSRTRQPGCGPSPGRRRSAGERRRGRRARPRAARPGRAAWCRAGPVNLAAALRHHARDPARPLTTSAPPRMNRTLRENAGALPLRSAVPKTYCFSTGTQAAPAAGARARRRGARAPSPPPAAPCAPPATPGGFQPCASLAPPVGVRAQAAAQVLPYSSWRRSQWVCSPSSWRPIGVRSSRP
jgi:hypothetical protein